MRKLLVMTLLLIFAAGNLSAQSKREIKKHKELVAATTKEDGTRFLK